MVQGSFIESANRDPIQVFQAEGVPALNPAEADAFARHSGVPGHDQASLAGARMALVGAGGLNSWTALALLRSGAKELVVIDHDVVDITNLPRQLYRGEDRGQPKSHRLGANLVTQGHAVAGARITTIARPFGEALVSEISLPCDVLVVGVDNNAARLFAAAWARRHRIPAVFTAQSADGGLRCYAFLQGAYDNEACLHCALPNLEPEEQAPCASVIIPGCFQAAAFATFFVYRALMGWPDGVKPYNYREADLLGIAPDVTGFVGNRPACRTCGNPGNYERTS